jgi:hypothetical protein
LYVGADLIAISAVRSQPTNDAVARKQFGQWIAGLSESEKTALLSRFAIDNELGLRAELLGAITIRALQSARLRWRNLGRSRNYWMRLNGANGNVRRGWERASRSAVRRAYPMVTRIADDEKIAQVSRS